jgi:mono/diheme cytochrome c family protein
VRQRPVGFIFNTISNGIRNMPAYGPQIPVTDRWAIVAYVRALQRSQDARATDVPPELQRQLR